MEPLGCSFDIHRDDPVTRQPYGGRWRSPRPTIISQPRTSFSLMAFGGWSPG
jgi:hypothetical protein